MRLVAFFLFASAIALLSSAGDGGQPEPQPDYRKLLADPNPQARLRAAVALVQQADEQAVGVLIDLLADLPHDERLQAEQSLQELAGEWAPNPALRGDDELSRKIRREAWAGWWRSLDGPALLAAFRRNEGKDKLPPTTARLLALRKPAGAAEALLAYFPFNDDHLMKEEIGKALKKLAMAGGAADPAVLAALSDPLPLRRSAAAEALAAAGGAKHWPLVRKLLKDADPEVRLRAAVALVYAQDKEAVPALIDLVGELPRSQTWEAEDLLHLLAGDKAPPRTSGDTAAARKKLRAGWQAWWKTNSAVLNMAELDRIRSGLGLTLVVEITPKGKAKKGAVVPLPPVGATDRVVAIDRSGQIQWKIEDLSNPMDVQLLPGNRVLIAEYGGRRVTERDSKGAILWKVDVPGVPVNVQRLANGNTFIALDASGPNGDGGLMEVDPAGNTVFSKDIGNIQQIPKGAGPGGFGGFGGQTWMISGQKLADGQMVYVRADGTCFRLDATGKEVKDFVLPMHTKSSGNIDVTAKGHIVVAQNDNTVAEYDPDGKLVWQVKAQGNRATRLPNGNTLVASLNGGVVEVDSTGHTVWQYTPPPGYQAVLARRQ